MSTYENAPATRMLATHCAACGRALVDANSVEAGMGPDCREKYGYADAVGEDVRAQANAFIHAIAMARSTGGDLFEAARAAKHLEDLGLPRLAKVVLKVLAKIRIEESAGRLLVKTPYSEMAVNYLRSVPGRRWDGEQKVNTFPISSRAQLWAVLQLCFAGEVGLGPRGVFKIGCAS